MAGRSSQEQIGLPPRTDKELGFRQTTTGNPDHGVGTWSGQGLVPWGAVWTETRWGLEKGGHLGACGAAGGDAGSG